MGDMTAGWYDEGESGPPTMEDWEWYVAHVMVVQDRPPAVSRQPPPMDGQLRLDDTRCQAFTFWEGFSVRCAHPDGHEGGHQGWKELSGWPGPEQR